MNDKCPLCGKGNLRKEVSEFRSGFIDAAGIERDVVVPNVLKFRCDSCDEYILDPQSESRISTAQRKALGLLGATELQRFRQKLSLSQEGMAELLGLGKKTWCRWESDDHFQSEAFDRYLRLLIEVPANVEMLKLIARGKCGGAQPTPTDSRIFVYLRNWELIEDTERQFTAMLNAGTAFTAT